MIDNNNEHDVIIARFSILVDRRDGIDVVAGILFRYLKKIYDARPGAWAACTS